ncbi:MAG: hypothetical protein FWC56_00050, partial [Phycisphaerae bacterium]|nr:hypothetical protein [Phycisphaerae bacterium]
KTIPAILRHFALQEKYDLTADQVEAYAERVEQLVRPEVTSQIMAGVLGCLPKAYRRQLVAGGEVLLVSRVLQALNMQESGLRVAEMAKLASILLSLGRQSRSEETGRRSRSGKQSQKSGARDVDVNEGDGGNMDGVDSIQLAESLRLLYGLQWPPHPISPLTSPSTSSPTSASTSAPITTTEAYDSVQPDIGRP